MKKPVSRREFIVGASAAGTVLAAAGKARAAQAKLKPAILGGPKAHPESFPGWPVYDETDEQALLEALRSGGWFRRNGKKVEGFEAKFAELNGAAHCLATSCGTTALTAAIGALDIGPGAEVIVPPYTFVATYNCVTAHHALPVFVDTDRASFQIDAEKIESAITPETRAILPVHIGGSPSNMDRIMQIADEHRLPVVEDACQAHMGEWRGKKLGTIGLAGCFSFQASKNLTSGEGGAVLTDDEQFHQACYNFHYQGRADELSGDNWSSRGTRGLNLRLCEFQGSVLLSQMLRLEKQAARRSKNAALLTEYFSAIPGVESAKLYEGTTASAWHLYMFRFDKEQFAGMNRGQFIKALSAEGIPASSGYRPLNRGDYVKGLASNRHYRRIYGEKRMAQWLESTLSCPENDKVCEEAVWFTQNMLLGESGNMRKIAEAVENIHAHASEIAKT